jgi:hypothetical protein
VIVSKNYCAAFATVRTYIGRWNIKQQADIAEHGHEVWQNSSSMFTPFALKSAGG